MAETIRIVSYNTHLFGGTVAGLLQKYEDKDRADAIVKHVVDSQCDIACFCEVWSDRMKERIRRKLDGEMGAFYFYDLPFYKAGDGLLICSKFPILPKSRSHIGFKPNLSGWDALAQKGAIAVVVARSETEHIRLILTHTQAEDSDEAKANRGLNLDAIETFVKLYYPNLPAIICGDFNVGHAEYDSMKARFPDFEDCGHGANEITYDPENDLVRRWGKNPHPERYDYFLAKGITPVTFETPKWKYESEDDGQVDCSDHYPILMEFRIVTARPAPGEYPDQIKAFAYVEQKRIFEEISEGSLPSVEPDYVRQMAQQRAQDLQTRFWVQQQQQQQQPMQQQQQQWQGGLWEQDLQSRFRQMIKQEPID